MREVMDDEVPTSELSGFSSDFEETGYHHSVDRSPESCRTSELSEINFDPISSVLSPRKRRCLNLEWNQDGSSERTSQLSGYSEDAVSNPDETLGCQPLPIGMADDDQSSVALEFEEDVDYGERTQTTSECVTEFELIEDRNDKPSISSHKEFSLPKDAFVFFDIRKDDKPLKEELWNAGVRVSQFLCKGVTHLITDRQRKNVQPERVTKELQKISAYSRSACMMKKALTSTNNIQRDIFSKALTLNVEIVPLQTLQNFLDVRHRSTYNVREKVVKVQCRKLKPPFIKIEDHSRKYRPPVKEFSQWPVIEGHSKSFSDKKKTGLKEKKDFCENCNIFIDHKDLNSHFKSDLHQDIISQEGYYDSVDNARQSIPSVEEFVNNIRSKRVEM